MDPEKKMHREKARKELYKNTTSYFEQIPEATQLYGYLLFISKTIQVRWTRHMGHCLRSKYKLISDILLWTLSYGHACVGWLAWTYTQQLCAATGCSLEDPLGVMDDRDGWKERLREICASSVPWWWGWWWFANKYNWLVDLVSWQ